jgi:hypothetical protein
MTKNIDATCILLLICELVFHPHGSRPCQTYVFIFAQLCLNTAGGNMGCGGKIFDVNRKLAGGKSQGATAMKMLRNLNKILRE